MPGNYSRTGRSILQNPQIRSRSNASKCRPFPLFLTPCLPVGFAVIVLTPMIFWLPPTKANDREMAREEAQFDILIAGREIGKEKFLILSSEDSVSTQSTTSLRNSGDKRQDVEIKTELNANGSFLPRAYQLHKTTGGQKASIYGTFSDGQAMFEYAADGNPSRRGLLVGKQYILLDSNVFHHFIFIARLFRLKAEEEPQSFEVVVPQELDNGILIVREVGVEKIQVRGKRRDLHHLKADSGALLIDLWVDDGGILYKIALPEKQVEVVRH